MKSYARVIGGVVLEIIPPMLDAVGAEIPISERYHPSIVATLVAIPDGQPVDQWWTYADGKFSPPDPRQPS